MKKYENPEINISLFDIEVATDASATANAIEALNAVTGIKKVDSTTWENWEISF